MNQYRFWIEANPYGRERRAPFTGLKMNQKHFSHKSKNGASKISLNENAAGRGARLYESEVGPLMAWLDDEAHARNETLLAMSKTLGVTPGYLAHLRNGTRLTCNIGRSLAVRCAEYLHVQLIVVKLLAGIISIADFSRPGETEEDMINRELRAIERHKMARFPLPASPLSLPLDVKKSLVTMYGEVSGDDVFGLQKLPQILRELRSATSVFEEMSSAKRGETERLQNPFGVQSAPVGVHP